MAAPTFDPPELIEQAAQAENWTHSDQKHCQMMLQSAYEESFQVRMIQRTGIGLIAYDAPFATFMSVLFQEGDEKPVLHALEDLSRKLLNAKHERRA